MTSEGFIRTQPCDARLPSEPMSLVPWKPTDPEIPTQRATSGFCGEPPGIVLPAIDPAQSESGTCQTGFFSLRSTAKRPFGVGNLGWPTATRYDLTTSPSLKTRTTCASWSTVMTVGFLAHTSRS